MSSLTDLSAVEARRLIGEKTVSPKDLCQACIERIESVNVSLNAIVTTDFDRAMEAAVQAEAAVLKGEPLGPLHGLPLAIKDLSATKGLRTTFGSKFFADHVPDDDDDVVRRIKAAGAIVIGKTNTPEFGAGANTTNDLFGPTRNPYDPQLTCGGSSGGAAAALSSHMVPLANGSDLGGSLRIPAAFCGVVGFRPSPGVVGFTDRAQGWSSLPIQGPMGRTVDDTALLMSVLTGHSPGDPLSNPHASGAGKMEPVDLSTLKVAFSTDLGFAPVDTVIAESFQQKSTALSGLFRSAEFCDPDMTNAHEAFRILRAVTFVASYKRFYDADKDKLERNTRINVEEGLKLSLSDIAWAEVEATKIYRSFVALFEDFDLLICPTVPVQPFPADRLFVDEINGEKLSSYFHWFALTYGISLAAHPAVALPCGHIGHLPSSIQIVGPRGSDAFALSAARALEDVFADAPALQPPAPPNVTARPVDPT